MTSLQSARFGDLLRLYRQGAGLSQEQLAARANLSLRAVSDLERGINKRPRRQTLLLLAEALSLSPQQRAELEQASRKPAAPPAPLREPTTYVAPQQNLPLQTTSFVGREPELTLIRAALWKAGVRLVTLTGPGGSGKTRLALETAADLLADFADGVYFVNLAPLAQPEQVVSTIAHTMQVKEAVGVAPLDSLKEHLRQRSVLLILDNFEHVLGAGPQVADLLAAAGRLKVLATSRAPLRIRGEHELPVAPLTPPDAGMVADLSELGQNSAVRLFVERATAARPDFALTAENSAAIVEITRRLDGLPLAIELAAVRVKALAPQALLPRLESRLRLLTGGALDLPQRQQTLRNTIAWSYELLPEQERRLFYRLAVFRGGRRLEAVEELCSRSGDGDGDVLAGLALLVDNSMVAARPGPGGDLRYWMLDTIYEFARELLEASGEAEQLRRLHAEHFVALAEQAEPDLLRARQSEWLQRLDEDHDNLRAVLAWSLGPEGDAALGQRLAAALLRFWQVRGYLAEGRFWQDELLRRATGYTPSRAKLLYGAGTLASDQDDFAAAGRLCGEALAVFRKLGDQQGTARALNILGTISHTQGASAAAVAYFEEAVALQQQLGDAGGLARVINNLACVFDDLGDYQRAIELHERSLAVARESGDRRGIAASLCNLGMVALHQADYRRAQDYFAASLIPAREIGDKVTMDVILINLGYTALQQADYAGARDYFAEGMVLARELNGRENIAYCLEGLAGVAVAAGAAERGALLYGAAEALREATGSPLPPSETADYRRGVAAARDRLPAASFAAAWARGRGLALDQAILISLEAG